MEYVCILVAIALMGGGIGVVMYPAFDPEFIGYNFLGFVPVLVGLWLADIALSKPAKEKK